MQRAEATRRENKFKSDNQTVKMKRNIFVIGLEDFNLRLLRKVRHAEQYVFHPLLDYAAVTQLGRTDVETLLSRAFETLDAFPEKIDAIVGYWDFPAILMLPILRARYGLPGPQLESVLKCEHKYWARCLQKEALPECVPEFALVDPFADEAADNPPLDFPFWIKPIKAHSSKLGFRAKNASDYRTAIDEIRAHIGDFAVNLDQIMQHAQLPAEIAAIRGWHCIAEGIISSGRQCTLEGYVFEGAPHVYGVVDSVRGPNRSSFERYQYPSTLPQSVQQRMGEATERVIRHTGLDMSPFNVEYFWDRRSDRIWLLEINARISKSHSPLFEKVEGVPHNEVMIDVALGRQPEYPLKRGAFKHAAKFMYRLYKRTGEETVEYAPGPTDVQAIEHDFLGCDINLHIESGMKLKELHHQDSYSHELAEIFVGANSQKGLMQTYRAIVDRLGIRVETC